MSPLPVSGVILAGGRSTRFQGQDKGLLHLAGRPLIAHVIARVQPQVQDLAINANRHHAAYQSYGLPVYGDVCGDYAGPLAGMLTALHHAAGEYVLVVPCDMPHLPQDLAAELWRGLHAANARVAVAHDGARLQAAVALLRRDARPALVAALAAQQLKTARWMHEQQAAIVDFSAQADAFFNLNQAQDLDLAQQLWEQQNHAG